MDGNFNQKVGRLVTENVVSRKKKGFFFFLACCSYWNIWVGFVVVLPKIAQSSYKSFFFFRNSANKLKN